MVLLEHFATAKRGGDGLGMKIEGEGMGIKRSDYVPHLT